MKIEEEKYNFSDFSDDDDDGGNLQNTIAAIRKLDNHKQVLPAERSEPSLHVDEFHLIKDGDGGNAVKLSDLTRTLTKKFKDSSILQELKNAQRRTRTLPKPLEKPEAEKVQRTVGFEKVKTQLSHWEPVVRQNRAAEHQVFPIPELGGDFFAKEDLIGTILPETDLEKRMAEIIMRGRNNSDGSPQEDASTVFQLSLEEMVERRKEAARLRAQQSYMVAKARRQNKIKSKTYHRIARRERIRQQMKEFETLQQTNPEEALKRIEELEKERALERVTLRHRNTGKWARNQAVRAKYNKESREVLSEQLKLSRDLTKKVSIDSESSEEEVDEDLGKNTVSDNPWVNQNKTEAEVDDFITGYRKFWDGKEAEEEVSQEEAEETARKAEEKASEARAKYLLQSAVVAASSSVLAQDNADLDNAGAQDDEDLVNAASGSSPVIKKQPTRGSISPKVKSKESRNDQKLNVPRSPVNVQENRPIVNGAKPPSVKVIASKSGKWKVTEKPVPTEKVSTQEKKGIKQSRREVSTMFAKMDKALKRKAEEKVNELKEALVDEEPKKRKKKNKPRKKNTEGDDISGEVSVLGQRGANLRQRPDEDAPLDEGRGNEGKSNPANATSVNVPVEGTETSKALPEIDPNNFMKSVRTTLQTAAPDLLGDGNEAMDDDDLGARGEQQLTISEAFADDDVVAEFEQEKNEEIDKNKQKDIDLSLPGWGNWGGHNVEPDARKTKRFVIKAPAPAKRKDENKGHLYVNEKEENKLKPQQVRELPFPFKSVKDFEASVGAPISNTFIPETTHRKVTLPRVITKSGAIIKPISKEVLTKRREVKMKIKKEAGKKGTGKNEAKTGPIKTLKSSK